MCASASERSRYSDIRNQKQKKTEWVGIKISKIRSTRRLTGSRFDIRNNERENMDVQTRLSTVLKIQENKADTDKKF